MLQAITTCIGAAALLFLTPSNASASLTLIAKGKSAYQIVLPTNPIASERYAADELQRYLEKMSGVRLPIVREADALGTRQILLGDTAQARKLGLKVDMAELRTDGFVLRTLGNRLVIIGGRPRGTLNGVYTLLEEKLGVRWFTPELESVPKRSRVQLPDLNETKLPALENREVFWTEIMRDPDFAARHRLNGNSYKLTEKHGGVLVVYYPFVHSFDLLVPPDLYKEHPEYFPLIKGKRASGYVQRCLSNPDVVKLAIAKVRQWIKEHPNVNIISVSQNDTFNYCQCDQCKELDESEGSPAASLLKFVNAIAQDIEKDYPAVRIDTLAYQYTRKPPKTIRPRQNVIIRLCSIECCFAHPLETCASEANKKFRADIIAWQPVSPLLYIWDYTPNFAHYQQPFPNFDALQPNVQFFVKHNVRGLFEQGNYSSGGMGELGPLRAYVLAKLLWNPETDVQAHIREFCHAYYGNAASQILAYLDLLEQQVRGRDIHAHIFDKTQSPYLNKELISAADRIFEEAEGAATDETTRFHVKVTRLPIWYVQITNKLVEGSAREEKIKNFLEIARKAGISNISEGQTLNAWAEKIK